MDNVEDKTVHLVVTSPPYPMIEMWDEQFCQIKSQISEALTSGRGNIAFELMHRELDRVWKEISRVIIPGGIVAINIGDATRKLGDIFKLYPNHSRINTFFHENEFEVLPTIIWRKQTNKPNKFMGSGMLPGGAYVTLEHEYILLFRKNGRRKYDDSGKDNRRKSAYFWEERNLWFSDIWFDLKGTNQILKSNGSRERSAAYPLELVLRIINMYSNYDDLVLDPFLGTGTTMLASMLSKRNSIGYEIENSFKEIIEQKLKNVKMISKDHIDQRINNHLDFIVERVNSGKEIKHNSENYGFPVMSSQSKGIRFYQIINFAQTSESIKIEYGDMQKMSGLMNKIKDFLIILNNDSNEILSIVNEKKNNFRDGTLEDW